MRLRTVFIPSFFAHAAVACALLIASNSYAQDADEPAGALLAETDATIAAFLGGQARTCNPELGSSFPEQKFQLGDRELELSIVDEATAQKVFSEIATNRSIPFCFPDDGCFARAHAMARILEEKGIISGKIFVVARDPQNFGLFARTPNHPDGGVSWSYHVAEFIMVRDKNGSIRPRVIDPSLFDRLVSPEEWIKKQTLHLPRSTYLGPIFRERFTYMPTEINESPKAYDPRALEHASEVNHVGTWFQQLRKLELSRQKPKSIFVP